MKYMRFIRIEKRIFFILGFAFFFCMPFSFAHPVVKLSRSMGGLVGKTVAQSSAIGRAHRSIAASMRRKAAGSTLRDAKAPSSGSKSASVIKGAGGATLVGLSVDYLKDQVKKNVKSAPFEFTVKHPVVNSLKSRGPEGALCDAFHLLTCGVGRAVSRPIVGSGSPAGLEPLR